MLSLLYSSYALGKDQLLTLCFLFVSAAALGEKLATLSIEQREALDKDAVKKEKKEDAKAEREKARIAVCPSSFSFGPRVTSELTRLIAM